MYVFMTANCSIYDEVQVVPIDSVLFSLNSKVNKYYRMNGSFFPMLRSNWGEKLQLISLVFRPKQS